MKPTIKERMNIRKTFPWIPIIGILLTIIYHSKYGNTGIEEPDISITSAFLQAIYVSGIILLCIYR